MIYSGNNDFWPPQNQIPLSDHKKLSQVITPVTHTATANVEQIRHWGACGKIGEM